MILKLPRENKLKINSFLFGSVEYYTYLCYIKLKPTDMTKQELGLTGKNLQKLNKIEDKILGYKSLDKRMDYVDSMVIWSEFPEDLTDEQEDMIDEYLRDFVMDTM